MRQSKHCLLRACRTELCSHWSQSIILQVKHWALESGLKLHLLESCIHTAQHSMRSGKQHWGICSYHIIRLVIDKCVGNKIQLQRWSEENISYFVMSWRDRCREKATCNCDELRVCTKPPWIAKHQSIVNQTHTRTFKTKIAIWDVPYWKHCCLTSYIMLHLLVQYRTSRSGIHLRLWVLWVRTHMDVTSFNENTIAHGYDVLEKTQIRLIEALAAYILTMVDCNPLCRN